MKLDRIQASMNDFILHRAEKKALATVLENYGSEELAARLAIYRNNSFYSLIDALKSLYPAVVATIGDELFTACGREYFKRYPATDPAMINLGANFPEFLKDFYATESLAYLCDLATLELYHHQAYHAKDEESITAERFAEVPPEQLAQQLVKPHSSVRLLSSPFAIFDIWNLSNTSSSEPVNAEIHQSVLLCRPDYEVNTYLIDAALFTFFDALKKQANINDALEAAMETDDRFNPTEAISFLIQSGFATQIYEE